MKLGWRVLLPASLVNILVTGVVWLLLDQAGTGVSDALKVLADVTQAVIVVTFTYVTVRLVAGVFAPLTYERTMLGSSAEQAEKRGGTKSTAMQA
jgi:hypothetical protein